jgi:CDGSH-type Zn-finger protein
MDRPHIRILKDGPLHVTGDIPLYRSTILADREGYSIGYSDPVLVPTEGSYTLCRCGDAHDGPFCDGSHVEIDFDGTETADRRPYVEQADRTEGPGATLLDVLPLCAGTRHCAIAEGDTWELTERSGDPHQLELAIRTAQLCPAGRLVILDPASGQALEPEHAPSVVLLEDPEVKASGPVWVRGGIPVVSSDGTVYEIRNRMTLCRCGASRIKPFCDGSHIHEAWHEQHEPHAQTP